MIPEPHQSYLLELLMGLGPAAEHFVLAGAQAMKFMVPGARAGAEVALAESEGREINGRLPSGGHARAQARVIRPWALVMLKCLALEDRYRNLRGARHVEHDRNEARIHAGDIVSILSAQAGLEEFGARFLKQLEVSPDLKKRVLGVVTEFFGGETKPGFLLYEELLAMRSSPETGEEVQRALDRAERLLARLVDLCNRERSPCWPEERPR